MLIATLALWVGVCLEYYGAVTNVLYLIPLANQVQQSLSGSSGGGGCDTETTTPGLAFQQAVAVLALLGVTALYHLLNLLLFCKLKRFLTASNWMANLHPLLVTFPHKRPLNCTDRLRLFMYRLLAWPMPMLSMLAFSDLQKWFFNFHVYDIFAEVQAYYLLTNPLNTCYARDKIAVQNQALLRYKSADASRRIEFILYLEAEVHYHYLLVTLQVMFKISKLVCVGIIGGWFCSYISIAQFTMSIVDLLKGLKSIKDMCDNYSIVNTFTDVQNPTNAPVTTFLRDESEYVLNVI